MLPLKPAFFVPQFPGAHAFTSFCALGNLVITCHTVLICLNYLVQDTVESIEIISENMKMTFFGLLLSSARLNFTIPYPGVFTHFFVLGQIHGNASNYLFLQKVNSTLLLCQLGSEALLPLGQPLTAYRPTTHG